MTFAFFHCISEYMKYITETELSDINDYVLERFDSSKNEPQILFQTVAEDVLAENCLQKIIGTKSETFRDILFKMIKEKNLDEVEVYKRANMSRQLFSKIRSEKNYHPTKNTVFLLAMAMKLNIDETSELLDIAGYAFTTASKADLIVQYFLYHKKYDIFEINEVLDKYELDIL